MHGSSSQFKVEREPLTGAEYTLGRCENNIANNCMAICAHVIICSRRYLRHKEALWIHKFEKLFAVTLNPFSPCLNLPKSSHFPMQTKQEPLIEPVTL